MALSPGLWSDLLQPGLNHAMCKSYYEYHTDTLHVINSIGEKLSITKEMWDDNDTLVCKMISHHASNTGFQLVDIGGEWLVPPEFIESLARDLKPSPPAYISQELIEDDLYGEPVAEVAKKLQKATKELYMLEMQKFFSHYQTDPAAWFIEEQKWKSDVITHPDDHPIVVIGTKYHDEPLYPGKIIIPNPPPYSNLND